MMLRSEAQKWSPFQECKNWFQTKKVREKSNEALENT